MADAVRVVAAIDFGTYGTGFAWAYVQKDRPLTPENINLFENWQGSPIPYHKNLTALLLDVDGEVQEWGYQAHNRHLQERDSENTYHARFKMGLLHGEAAGIAAGVSGEGYPAAFLVTQYLRKFCEFALDHIVTRARVRAEEILWCITVPAIWGDRERQIMRDCAAEAGLPKSHDRLLIAVEPEVAALYAAHVSGADLGQPGSRFMVVDAGGGTVDLTAYEVRPEGLTEIGMVNGGSHGATYADQYLIETVLADRVGQDVISKIAQESPELLNKVLAQWEGIKRTFDPLQSYPMALDIPVPLMAAISAHPEARERLAYKQSGVDDHFLLSPQDVKKIFDHAIEPLLTLVEEQLKLAGSRSVQQVLLVGGFAQSLYLQQRLADRLGKRHKVVVPATPAAAVIVGAVHYAHDPARIRGRRTRFTYGVSWSEPFELGRDPISSKTVRYDGREMCSNRFKIFVRAGDVVEPGTQVPMIGVPTERNQRAITLKLLSTTDSNPRYATEPGTQQLGELTIDISKTMHLEPNARGVDIIMIFGGTEVETLVRDPRTGIEERAVIDFVRGV